MGYKHGFNQYVLNMIIEFYLLNRFQNLHMNISLEINIVLRISNNSWNSLLEK